MEAFYRNPEGVEWGIAPAVGRYYVYETEYPEEGAVGPFETEVEALAWLIEHQGPNCAGGATMGPEEWP